MLKMKGDPEMYMKTKDRTTFCPTQKATFVPGRTPFYTETQVFCADRRLFRNYYGAGEQTTCFQR